MFSVPTSSKVDFVADTRNARAARLQDQACGKAAVAIQSGVRGFLARRRVKRQIRDSFDEMFAAFHELDKSGGSCLNIRAIDSFPIIRRFIYIFNVSEDSTRFFNLCRYLISSIDSAEIEYSFVSLSLSKQHILLWVDLMKRILAQCCQSLKSLKIDLPSDMKHVNLVLHVLVSYTACNTWAILRAKSCEALKPSLSQLCSSLIMHITRNELLYPSLQLCFRAGLARKQPSLKHATFSALVSLSLRPLLCSNFDNDILRCYVRSCLSTPGLIAHLSSVSSECLALFMTHRILSRTVRLLCDGEHMRAICEELQGTYTLCLLANVVHLGYIEKTVLVENLLEYTNIISRLFEKCREYVATKQSSLTQWHPVLGWFSQRVDSGLYDSMPFVVSQLQLLWCPDMLKYLFADLVSIALPDLNNLTIIESGNDFRASAKSLMKKLMEQKNKSSGMQSLVKLGSPEITVVALVCSLYQNAITTLVQLKYDILSGLCFQDFLLPRLWAFINNLDPSSAGLKPFYELMSQLSPKSLCPEFQILILFSEAATYLLTIVDDIELYEQGKPFQLQQIAAICNFANRFVYRSIWDGLVDAKTLSSNVLFIAVHNLLILLYNRDCRRSLFPSNAAAADPWLIKELKASTFTAELEKNAARADLMLQKAPHVIPHRERVLIFRKRVSKEKESLGFSSSHSHSDEIRPSTLITVHRSRIVEDGYRQLSLLPTKALKGLVRVKFVNEQGLDEAGIDQDGVFKEFLEETIKRVFNPSLNLFKETSEGRLYPSPTSNMHENYLALFDFVGRILAKAIYEGIVVEVPFALFFLNHVLGRSSSNTYSSFDELPSLDLELYKNLTFLKHYEGDVSDLDLTFSCCEDYMGATVTHELVPGGRSLVVNNTNRISYIHLMAHFRMYVQIRDQLQAFVRGFRSILRPEWLSLFSAPELQKLISGATDDIDLDDLRKHTQYYGGFHSSHRVIGWLWDILANDFNADERKQFLRFVTSCSKPPLLGFAYLEPAFSIRCVEVADDQDQGDTLGSVIRGFLAVRGRGREPVGRLPTSSTCFNLLKLPNYARKTTLREKLRYAICHGTGFELS